jgi:hypothetical protein
MEKVILNYNKVTGQISDSAGTVIANWTGLTSIEPVKEPMKVQDLIDLKSAGFDVEEISAMRRKGIV